MQQNLKRLTVGRENDKLGLASVERLGCFIGSLPQLLVVARLLHQIQNLGRQSLKRIQIEANVA